MYEDRGSLRVAKSTTWKVGQKPNSPTKEDPVLAITYIQFNYKIYEGCFSDLVRKPSQEPFRHCFLDDFLR